MTASSKDDLVQSVRDRLRNAARDRGRPFTELLELYAVERFLHRLGSSKQSERFVLKGGTLLRSWIGADTRPTRDVDLLGPNDLNEESLRSALEELLNVDVTDDGISFDVGSIITRPIRIGSAVLGLRAKFDGRFGRTRLRYQIDVGLGDAVFPAPVRIVPGGLLGMPLASVRAYTPYTSVAEKLEAVVVFGNANSRTKDYYDLYRIPAALNFQGPLLVESVRRTFARRTTTIPRERPDGLSDSFALDPLHSRRWQAFLAKGQLRATEMDFLKVVERIREFAEPVLNAARDGADFPSSWPSGGGWRRVRTR
jgi:predicted nucleotidyltransferase component of viral defense system